MSLPDEISIALKSEGLAFEFRVSALRQGSERSYPSRECVCEFERSPDLQLAVALAAACALDAAVGRFLQEFEASLCKVLMDAIDGKVSPGETAHPEKEAA